MDNKQRQIKELEEKANQLLRQQNEFAKEVSSLHRKIQQLKGEESSIIEESIKQEEKEEVVDSKPSAPIPTSNFKFKLPEDKKPLESSSENTKDFEEFIGGNLLSKVGIIITIIGVAIGIKYSIDHNLISPVVRVLIGYVFGLSLIGIAFKLKPKYFTYSAVLLSGAVTMLYFITFFSYSIYQLFPQLLAFIIMVSITVFTVFSALNYNQQIIAQLGLVGAYAVPFLLSTGSGRVDILLAYTSIINIGILAVSYFRNWKSLIYSSFALSWIILASWIIFDFKFSMHFGLGMCYNFIFFILFYGIILVNKLFNREQISSADPSLILINSFFFYALGMYMLNEGVTTEDYQGLFTLLNAFFHAGIALLVHRRKLEQNSLFYFIIAIAISFVTMSIPIQLDGKWITILWMAEAVVLFSFGRLKKLSTVEMFSYPLLLLTFIHLLNDWTAYHSYYSINHPEDKITLIFNTLFLTTCSIIIGFAVITFIWQKKEAFLKINPLQQAMSFIIPGVLIFVCYMSLRLEIDNYWYQKYIDSSKNPDLLRFSSIWIINYSLFFFSSLLLLSIHKIKNVTLSNVTSIINLILILIFLGKGLYDLSELRESYLNSENIYPTSSFHLTIRYLSYPFLVVVLYALYQSTKSDQLLINRAKIYFELVLAISSLWVLSSELIGILNLAGFNNSYKLGLSILWGISSLVMISIGIFYSKKHLRITAIALFAFTLVKLFFYDIAHLGTIQKTVVFVSLGILLLIISFLYNKFKEKIND